jgi:hypothetical protein
MPSDGAKDGAGLRKNWNFGVVFGV